METHVPKQESQYKPWGDHCAQSLLQGSQNTLCGHTCAQVASVCHDETPVAKHSPVLPNAVKPPCPAAPSLPCTHVQGHGPT